MPANPKDSVMFAPLSYYRLSVPVVPLPRTLNQDAIRIASDFVVGAQQRHQRFLALGYMASYDTLHWLVEAAKHSYSVQELGTSNGIVVLEFTPLDSLGDSH
jgi:hypothetical protein